MQKTIVLTKNNINYVALKQDCKWNGDFDGGYLYFIDKAMPDYLRVGVDEKAEEIILFNKKEFISHCKKYHNQIVNCHVSYVPGDDEYEHYSDLFNVLIDFDPIMEGKIFYMHCIDSILDIYAKDGGFSFAFIKGAMEKFKTLPKDEFLKEYKRASSYSYDKTLIESQNMIKRLADYKLEENHDYGYEYIGELASSSELVFDEEIDTKQDFVERYYKHIYCKYGSEQLISEFDKYLDRV